ncbi:MAG: hypothetical protein NTZ53_11420 [Cyanobacteria bacterium]|nr:hypothetical protein [Cyanobacteriota bacterium]
MNAAVMAALAGRLAWGQPTRLRLGVGTEKGGGGSGIDSWEQQL